MEKPDLKEILKKLHSQKEAVFAYTKKQVLALLRHSFSKKELLVILVVAFLVGATAKTYANDTLTIGFDDYRVSHSRNILDLNTIQGELIRQGGTFAIDNDIPEGETCSE